MRKGSPRKGRSLPTHWAPCHFGEVRPRRQGGWWCIMCCLMTLTCGRRSSLVLSAHPAGLSLRLTPVGLPSEGALLVLWVRWSILTRLAAAVDCAWAEHTGWLL